jgi:hypothetical protein
MNEQSLWLTSTAPVIASRFLGYRFREFFEQFLQECKR